MFTVSSLCQRRPTMCDFFFCFAFAFVSLIRSFNPLYVPLCSHSFICARALDVAKDDDGGKNERKSSEKKTVRDFLEWICLCRLRVNGENPFFHVYQASRLKNAFDFFFSFLLIFLILFFLLLLLFSFAFVFFAQWFSPCFARVDLCARAHRVSSVGAFFLQLFYYGARVHLFDLRAIRITQCQLFSQFSCCCCI